MSERLVCGLQPVREAIAAHGPAARVVVEDKRDAPQLDALARFARDRGATVERVRRGDLDRASHGVRHQGAIAWVPALRVRALEELELPAPALVVVLDSIEDPQNFGAVVRSSVAFGASAIVWAQHGAAPLTPATFRASAGAIEHAQLASVPSLVAALGALRDRGLRILGLDAGGDRPIDAENLADPVALVLGAEAAGLHNSVRRACDAMEKTKRPAAVPAASTNNTSARRTRFIALNPAA